jgi:hypothetical protein
MIAVRLLKSINKILILKPEQKFVCKFINYFNFFLIYVYIILCGFIGGVFWCVFMRVCGSLLFPLILTDVFLGLFV